VINSAGGIYHGVLDSTVGKVFEIWDSGITGYQNYAVAYSAQDATNAGQMVRASPVEVHSFIRVDSSNLSGGVLSIQDSLVVDSTNIPYSIHTIHQVYNRTSGFPHRLEYVKFNSPLINIKPAAGYEFISGMILEITADVIYSASNINIRNGAAVNFSSRLRGIDKFTRSVVSTATYPNYEIDLGATAEILGWSTTDTTLGLSQAVCWGTTTGNMYQIDTTRVVDYSKIILTGPSIEDVDIQLSVRDKVLSSGTLSVGYNYIPTQCQGLPASLTIEPVNGPSNIFVSNNGSGGGDEGIPYSLPIEHIPVNDPTITSDKIFSNFIHLELANYLTSGGFLQIPVLVPGTFFGSTVTLSSPALDSLNRAFYKACSQELQFKGEDLQTAVPRKVYLPVLARIVDGGSTFLKGEYVLTIFSRPVITEQENNTGYFSGEKCSISVYRLLNRPLT
jgi:hypothetical protein